MHARLAVLKTPPKSSVLSLLLLYKNSNLLTHPKSTLLQVLIPLHFNSPAISIYEKPGGGAPPRTRKVLQLVTPTSRLNLLLAPVAVTVQPTENTIPLNPASSNVDAASSLSPLFVTLTKNTGGGVSATFIPPKHFLFFPQRVNTQHTATPATPLFSCRYFALPVGYPKGRRVLVSLTFSTRKPSNLQTLPLFLRLSHSHKLVRAAVVEQERLRRALTVCPVLKEFARE